MENKNKKKIDRLRRSYLSKCYRKGNKMKLQEMKNHDNNIKTQLISVNVSIIFPILLYLYLYISMYRKLRRCRCK